MPFLLAKAARAALAGLPGMLGSNPTLKMLDAVRHSLWIETPAEFSVSIRQSFFNFPPWSPREARGTVLWRC